MLRYDHVIYELQELIILKTANSHNIMIKIYEFEKLSKISLSNTANQDITNDLIYCIF